MSLRVPVVDVSIVDLTVRLSTPTTYEAICQAMQKAAEGPMTGNSQHARVTSYRCRTNGVLFHATCEFDFDGDGLQRSVFDHAFIIHRREKELQSGKPLAHQLAAITVHGPGTGTVEIDGLRTNGQPVVTEMRLRFYSRGHPSPVSVSLEDLVLRNGEIQSENEMVARVNTLTFRQKSPPKMEVTLASVKKKDAKRPLAKISSAASRAWRPICCSRPHHHARRPAGD